MKTKQLKKYLLSALVLMSKTPNAINATLVDTIYRGLLQYQPGFNGTTFAMPQVNYLGHDFLIQTPDIWGQTLNEYNDAITKTAPRERIDKTYLLPTCQNDTQCAGERRCARPVFLPPGASKLCTGAEIQFQLRLYQAIVSANHSVDITTLQPEAILQSAFSDGAFTPVLQQAFIDLAIKAHVMKLNISVRMLQGEVLPITMVEEDPRRRLSASLDPQTRFLQQVVNHKDFPQSSPYFKIYLGTAICLKTFFKICC